MKSSGMVENSIGEQESRVFPLWDEYILYQCTEQQDPESLRLNTVLEISPPLPIVDIDLVEAPDILLDYKM